MLDTLLVSVLQKRQLNDLVNPGQTIRYKVITEHETRVTRNGGLRFENALFESGTIAYASIANC